MTQCMKRALATISINGIRVKNRWILNFLVRLWVVWISIDFSTTWLTLIGLIPIALVMYRG
jgi:hypothetical protein